MLVRHKGLRKVGQMLRVARIYVVKFVMSGEPNREFHLERWLIDQSCLDKLSNGKLEKKLK